MKTLFSRVVLAGICAYGSASTVGGTEPMPVIEPTFALGLYRQLIDHSARNVFVSPVSIESALAMSAQGARGKTRQQILDTLHISNPQGCFTSLAKVLKQQPDQDASTFQLHVANALWAQSGFALRPEYVEFLKEKFDAQARPLDFQNPEQAGSVINQWVRLQTRDKIKDLLPSGSLMPQTRMVLTNAVYFRADWLEKFDPQQTKKASFQVTSDRNVEVDMMHLSARLRYAQTQASHVVCLPYVGGTASMYLIVPKTPDGLKLTEQELTPEWVSDLNNRLGKREVRLSLPRFQITDTHAMSKILQTMGITDAFDPQQADFSGISDAKPFYIQQVHHKTYVNIDEKGIEAAGATGVVMEVTSLPMPEEPVEVVADRPFVFLIQDHATRAILFIGRLCDPSQAD